MWDNLYIIHCPIKSNDKGNNYPSPLHNIFLWKTCMRNLYISDLRLNPYHNSNSGKVYIGYEAYQLLLEIVLGLHSALPGETEVFHQFRKALLMHDEQPLALQSYLRKLYQDITVDMRSIRSQYMHSLGAISYAAIARQLLKECRNILLCGTGQLAKEILFLLCKKNPKIKQIPHNIYVLGRNIESLNDIAHSFGVPICHYNDINSDSDFSKKQMDALIIVAPIPFQPYLPYLSHRARILDFSPFSLSERAKTVPQYKQQQRYYSLQNMLHQSNQNQDKRHKLLWKLKPVLASTLQQRQFSVYQSNYSWEDINYIKQQPI